MEIDIPHMIATIAILFGGVWGLDQTNVLDNMSKGRKSLIKIVLIFVALFILNMVWSYGSDT